MDRNSEDPGVSRRDFFVRAGQLGGVLLVGAPELTRSLSFPAARLADPEVQRDLSHGILSTLSATPPSSLYSGLRWRHLGPFRGGRVDAVSGVPGRPNEFYYGSVNGGVWKSVDAGRVWEPVFDDQPVASIGALAVAPSAADVLYVGTGESTLRDSAGNGNGVYKSADAGRTWTHVGLENTRHIGRVAVDPTNPDIVFVAAIGHFYGPHPDRGVFRSKDGGKSWQKVLYKDENVGAVDVVIDPTNPRVVYACLWATRRPPWFVYAPTNGPGGGIYKSIDGGDTWTELTEGLPTEGMGRSGIAVCPTEPNRLYAVVDNLRPPPGAAPPDATGAYGAAATGQGGFFRSDDAGASWTKLSDDSALWGRGWYFEKVVVDPTDADVVFVPNVSVSRSMDGGKTWVPLKGSPGGDDYHQSWISADDPNTMVVASDQGCVITRNAKAPDAQDVTWSSWLNQATAQIYHVSVDPRFPYWVTGAQQDSGAVAVRSRGKFAEISMRDWEPIGAGGESGCTVGDPLHPGTIYGGTGGRYDMEHNRSVPGTTQPSGPEDARTDWTQPLVLSGADPRALYYANQFVFKSTDTAKSWTRISPDLTRPDPGVPSTLDATAAEQTDRNGKRGVVYTVAPSPLLVPMVWVGTDDGLVHVSTNDGRTWKDVTPPEVGPWSRVTTIEASHFDFNAAYASVDRHQLEDFEPHIYRTRDMGKSWQKITNGLAPGAYVHVVREDPMRPGLLFAGTERGVYLSFDDGDSWQPLQLNLPVTSMRDFQVYGNDLILATHGRGFWVIDDISVLRQLDDTAVASATYLFQPADAVLVDQGGDNGTPFQRDEAQAQNPPDGAYVDYWLASDVSGPVSVEILDEGGKVLATFSNQPGVQQSQGGRGGGRPGAIPNTSALWRQPPDPFSTAAGMHRVAWSPNGGRGRGFGGGPQTPPVPLPAQFTARLTVNGQAQTRTFTVSPDPRF